MTFTYDIATTIGQVRFLCQDTDVSSCTGTDRSSFSAWFSDEEVQFAIDNASSIKLAAALLLRSLLSNKYFTQNTNRLGSWGADISSAISAVEKAIAQLEGGEEPYFVTAEMAGEEFGMRTIVDNDALRDTD
jgi:hypothetical protein